MNNQSNINKFYEVSSCLSDRIMSVINNIPEKVYDLDYIYPTVMGYVNDAIGFRMNPETILFYSEYCFGTADALIFNEHNKFLRIHDLKTGKAQAKMEQLVKYASLFCLEYAVDPEKITTELRIYQDNTAVVYNPLPSEITAMMNTIIEESRELERFING